MRKQEAFSFIYLISKLKDKEHVCLHEQGMVCCLPSSSCLSLSRQVGFPYFHQQIANADKMDTEMKMCIC